MRSPIAALVVACALAPVTAPADDWPFDDRYDSALVFLHATLDYAFHPRWDRQWERGLVKGNGLRGTAGSISTKDLLTRVQVNVAEPVGSGFRVLYHGDRAAGLRDVRDRDQFAGLEKSVVGESGLQLLGDPASDKEELDVLVGVLLADDARERYLRLWLRLDDPVWGRKNDRGGRSVREAIGPQWALLLTRGRWELFSQGRYSRPSERVFDDPGKSPTIAAEWRRRGDSETKLRCVVEDGPFAELRFTHYDFEERIEFRDPAASYRYENRILRGRLVGDWPLGVRFRGRVELHHVRQDAKAEGARDYDFERRDVPWALHVEWLPSPAQVWNFGYLVSHYEWDYFSRDDTDPFDASSSVDKLKLAWTFLFSERARVLVSLSHEPEPNRFGGGNLQLQALF